MIAPANAQSSGSWHITVTQSGTTTANETSSWSDPPFIWDQTFDWNGKDELGFLPAPLGTKDQWVVNASGSYTVLAMWLDDYGAPAPNPPPKLSLLLRGDAGWEAPAQNAVISDTGAADGLGDALVSFANPESIAANSEGAHLRQYDSSSGVVTDTISQSASVTAQSD